MDDLDTIEKAREQGILANFWFSLGIFVILINIFGTGVEKQGLFHFIGAFAGPTLFMSGIILYTACEPVLTEFERKIGLAFASVNLLSIFVICGILGYVKGSVIMGLTFGVFSSFMMGLLIGIPVILPLVFVSDEIVKELGKIPNLDQKMEHFHNGEKEAIREMEKDEYRDAEKKFGDLIGSIISDAGSSIVEELDDKNGDAESE